jgi:outer membrane protein assembly factor BamB
MQSALGCALAVVVWWAFFSRARWFERLGAIVLMIVGMAGSWYLKHESMSALWLVGYAVPVLCVALVAGAVVSRRLPDGRRRATMAASILFACGVWTLVRTEGITGDHDGVFHWRWTNSPEERLLANAGQPMSTPSLPPAAIANKPLDKPAARPDAPATPKTEPAAHAATETPGEWPGFRGRDRDGIVHGVQIETDWSQSPPVEMWRRPIGPGWSSFAIRGDVFYTQEQRGEDEVVAAHKVSTGELVWRHSDPVRFFESNGGAGPRATPTVSNGRVYTFGATGILNALDAGTGAVVWSRDAASDTDGSPSFMGGTTKIPDWGFSSSPLVVGDVVIVAVAGQLVAYDVATGKPRWLGPDGGGSYSSPHLATIHGVVQVLLMSGAGATSVAPTDGKRLWEHSWRGLPVVQPALTADGDVLIVAGGESGIRRITVAHGPDGWTAERRWGSAGLKPYFNDFVVHKGHAFGFDGRILACIDLEDGTRKWKGGRYGSGQLVLLPDQDVLLVLSEEGEVALVGATPDQFRELARFQAIEGKTWNHPVLVGDVLLVRNGEEMAAFRLSPANHGAGSDAARR